MPHGQPAWVDIPFKDAIRKIRFRHNDLADLEQATSKGLQQLMAMSFYGLRTVLFYGLKWRDAKLTTTDVGNLIQDQWLADGKTLDDLADYVEEALIRAGIMPEDKRTRAKREEFDEGNASPDAA